MIDLQSQPLTITELNFQIRQTLSSQFRGLWVEGEISDIARPRSGHIYLTLKDQDSQIRAVIWNRDAQDLPFQIGDGQTILCFGHIDVYPARGSYQLNIKRVEIQGTGGLHLALKQLQAKLSAEGLFDAARKQPLPRFPRRIGVLTSPTSAAVRDFLQVVERRWPKAEIIVIPSKVQGVEAIQDILRALKIVSRMAEPLDVLVLARGGGSLEDLWCFNDESIIRAIARVPIPTVSAIGHEIDVTLTDLVCDRRALTPSEAGELVVPSREEIAQHLDVLEGQFKREIVGRIKNMRDRFSLLAQRPVLANPYARLETVNDELLEMRRRLQATVPISLGRAKQQLSSCCDLLEAVNPLSVLARGYSITSHQDSGKVVRRLEQVSPLDALNIRLADGTLQVQVQDKRSLEES